MLRSFYLVLFLAFLSPTLSHGAKNPRVPHSATPPTVPLQPLTLANFVSFNSKQNAVGLSIMYPGKSISGVCGISLRFNHVLQAKAYQKLFKQLRVKGAVSPTVVRKKFRGGSYIELKLTSIGMYVGSVSFSTVSGRSIHQIVQTVAPPHVRGKLQGILMALPCVKLVRKPLFPPKTKSKSKTPSKTKSK